MFTFQGINLGFWQIHWYGVLIALSIVIGIFLAVRRTKKLGYNSERFYDFCLLAIPMGVIFARIYYVVFEFDMFRDNPISMLYLWQGGLAIYGVLIGAALAAVIFSRMKRGIPFLTLMDITLPSIALGQAIGRWGNFFNQEAFGSLITDKSLQFFPIAVEITKTNAAGAVIYHNWHMATFFYESCWNILVFICLTLYAKKARKPGNVLLLYFTLYGFGRMIIETFRTDSLWLVPGVIKVSQLLSAVLFIVCGLILIYRHYRTKRIRDLCLPPIIASTAGSGFDVPVPEASASNWEYTEINTADISEKDRIDNNE